MRNVHRWLRRQSHLLKGLFSLDVFLKRIWNVGNDVKVVSLPFQMLCFIAGILNTNPPEKVTFSLQESQNSRIPNAASLLEFCIPIHLKSHFQPQDSQNSSISNAGWAMGIWNSTWWQHWERFIFVICCYIRALQHVIYIFR